MADRTLTINHADGGSETYTINRDKFAGVREMVIDGDNVSVDHTAPDMTQGHHFVDRAGESRPLLSKVAGGATAAYSLRDLNDRAGNNKVVRVRRDSDNAERDFKAKEVSNGTLKKWVNAQTTLPLDLKTLEADGRTGAIIDAKAAYSLRNLSSSYTGNVIEVRRSSDDTERDFTAAEVSDGTLLAWVGSGNDGFVKTWYDQSSTTGTANNNHATQSDSSKQPKIVSSGSLITGGVDFDGSTTQLDITGFSPVSLTYGAFTVASIDDNTSSSLRTIFDSSDSSDGGFAVAYGNTTSKFTPFWFDGDDSTPNLFTGGNNMTSSESLYSLIIKTGASTTHINGSLNETVTNTWTTAGSNSLSKSTIGYDQDNAGRQFNGRLQEIIIYDTDQTDNRTALEANIGEHYSISGIPAYDNTVNGFVETWYDQSGNGNDATQTSADLQPTIVSNGSLQQDADGNTAVKFDGTDDYLVKSDASPALFGPYTFFTHSDRDGDNGNLLSITGDADVSARYFTVYHNTDSSQFNPRSNTSQTVSQTGLTGTNVRLTTVNTTSDTSYSVGTNGATFTTGTTSYGTMPADPDGCPRIIIGKLREGATSGGQIFGGFITEIIAYAGTTNGDQTDNRPAIEANIANQYGLTLS